MTTTMNTGAASLLPCPFCGCSASPELNGNGIGDNWLECVECGASTRLREDGAGSVKDWNRRASTPQADAAPIINGHAINDLFLKWSEWTTELGEAISRKNIDGFVSELRAAIAAGGAQETAAARDVLAERQRQVSAEGWTPEHDDEHDSEEMAVAAACYAESAAGFHHPATGVPHTWPWTNRWWKPTTPRRDLVKAGALILAEIERLDRATASNGKQA